MKTITELEVKLDKSDFIRIHRAVIVNVNFIREFVKWFAGRYKRNSKTKRNELIVSRRYADQNPPYVDINTILLVDQF